MYAVSVWCPQKLEAIGGNVHTIQFLESVDDQP
jgi:hypothetical protein